MSEQFWIWFLLDDGWHVAAGLAWVAWVAVLVPAVIGRLRGGGTGGLRE